MLKSRPKLKLLPRGTHKDAKTTSADSSKPKSNPFGAARPREEVLKQRGVQVKDEDEKSKPRAQHGGAPAKRYVYDAGSRCVGFMFLLFYFFWLSLASAHKPTLIIHY